MGFNITKNNQSLKKIFIHIVLMLCLTASFAQPLELQGDLRVHDPVMVKEGDTYYIFSTGPGISIKTSKDKIHWKNSGRVFDKDALPAWHKNDIPEQDGHLWAPDISYRNGKYHLYYSVSAWMNFNSSIGYATNATLNAEDPRYEWVDEGKVIDFRTGGEGVNVIDPNIFVDVDKRVWLLYGSYKAGLRMTELNVRTGLLAAKSPTLTTLTTALGEGVFLIKDENYYYIFASRGICCKGLESNYQVVVGRAENLQGPYLTKDGGSWMDNKYSVMLAGSYEEPGRGHNGFFTEGDTTYMLYHAYSRKADGKSLLNICPLYVDSSGWPTPEHTGKLFKRVDASQGRNAGKKVACVGNSITEGAAASNRAATSYVARLSAMLGNNYNVGNFGLSGATACRNTYKPYLSTKSFSDAVAFQPDVVTIMLGTNDSQPRVWNTGDFAASFEADLTAMVDTFLSLKSKPKVYLCLPIPIVPNTRWPHQPEVLAGKIIPKIKNVARQKNLEIIDCYTPLLDCAACYPDNDKLHPNDMGHELMAKQLYAMLKSYFKK